MWIGWLAALAQGSIIYGKPQGFLQQPTQPASSVASRTVETSNELLKGAESVYGPYGAHAQHGHGFGHEGGDLAVVVTGGYKVADAGVHGKTEVCYETESDKIRFYRHVWKYTSQVGIMRSGIVTCMEGMEVL